MSRKKPLKGVYAEAAKRLALEPPTPLDDAKKNAEKRLQEHLDAFVRGNDRSDAALMRYFRGIVRIVDKVPEIQDLKVYRPSLIGQYFEAGIRLKRTAGRPALQTKGGVPIRPLLLYLWDQINLDRGCPIEAGDIPAAEIAKLLMAWKDVPALTPEQVRKVLKPPSRK